MTVRPYPASGAFSLIDVSVSNEVRRFHTRSMHTTHPTIVSRTAEPMNGEDLERFQFAEARFSTLNPEPLGASPRAQALRRHPSANCFREMSAVETETHLRQVLVESFATVDKKGRRPYPSGGAMYPIEVVAFLLNQIDPAAAQEIYHYLPVSNALEVLATPSTDNLLAALGGKKIATETYGSPAFALVYFLYYTRALVKYRYKGYRLALMEAGAMFHQADLVANSLELRTRLWSGYSDHAMCVTCGLDPRSFAAVCVQLVGA